jgi:hypothetical protein
MPIEKAGNEARMAHVSARPEARPASLFHLAALLIIAQSHISLKRFFHFDSPQNLQKRCAIIFRAECCNHFVTHDQGEICVAVRPIGCGKVVLMIDPDAMRVRNDMRVVVP